MGTDESPGTRAAEAAAALAVKAKEKAGEIVGEAQDALTGIRIPGVPGSRPPSLVEPTEPQEPLPPKEDQQGAASISPTGQHVSGSEESRAQQGAYLTTAQGARLSDTDHSLKAGKRGPTLLQDHHLREKITHFDHERIPERVVHARGAAAHGTFRAFGNGTRICRAGFLAEGVETPVFVRFSTVVGSRGSADVVRDTRGFATKFYTGEGTFDLVGNNIPVFFIQDAIKFPDVVHAAKPHPDREIPQAQSAHDTFWDFVSLHTEAQHHAIWQMSDRAIPRSYRTMEGFGIHTFRLLDEDGASTLVKFHWKPVLGVHSVVWEEAQLINGVDPDFHRRDLADAIEASAYPEFELGVQVLPDTPDQTFEGIDLLDPTKIVPEELAPVQAIGRMTLHANPRNYFAETEQVAFHPGHLVPGIDVTDDPLLQGRLFSYLDTQISRLGGPNFGQLPINRPQAPVNDMLRDGIHQSADHVGVAPYRPNSLDGGCPFTAGTSEGAFLDVPHAVQGHKQRANPASFADHFSQATLFWKSMTPIEQDHIVGAYTFELGKCYEQAVKERQLQCLANIDAQLCERVASGLGLPAPAPTQPPVEVTPSPALSQLGQTWPVDGRVLGLVVDETTDPETIQSLRTEVHSAGMVALVVAPRGGQLPAGEGPALAVQRSLMTARSVEFDAVFVLAAPSPESGAPVDAKEGASSGDRHVDTRLALLVAEAFRHGKAIGATGAGTAVLDAVSATGHGVVRGEDAQEVLRELLELLGGHRVWDRFPTSTSPA